MSLRNSVRVDGSCRKLPSIADVTMHEFCFSTPRIIMQRCCASMTTPTPPPWDSPQVEMRKQVPRELDTAGCYGIDYCKATLRFRGFAGVGAAWGGEGGFGSPGAPAGLVLILTGILGRFTIAGC